MTWSTRFFILSLTAATACSGDDTASATEGNTDSSTEGSTSNATGSTTTTSTSSTTDSSTTTSGSTGSSTTTSATDSGSTSGSSTSTGTSGSGSSGATATGSTSGTTGSTGSTTSGGTTTGGTTTGGTTGGVSEPECMGDKDCKLQNDCCGCEALHESVKVPPCGIQCLVPTCQPLGITGVECRYGTCTFQDLSCDPDLVTCKEKPPNCAKGQLPYVDNDCWGGCTAVEACDVVPDCGYCTDAEVCVQTVTQLGTKTSCQPIPVDCQGTADCACADEVCQAPFDTCGDNQDGIQCSCPNC